MKNPTPDLDRHWHHWLSEHQGKRAMVDQAREVILSLNYLEYTPDPASKQRIFQKIQEETHPGERSIFGRMAWLRAAAVFLFILGTAALVYFYVANRPQEGPSFTVSADKELLQYSNAPGERTQHVLPDGTQVDLQAGSTLEYPEVFGTEARIVRLEGEAYFAVAHDSDWPFNVLTEDFAVTVLGTQFNVNTKSSFPSVALVDGKVRLSAHASKDAIELTPNQMGLFDKQELSFTSTSFDPNDVIGWKDGYLVFREASFDEVVEKLQAWYGVEVAVVNQPVSDWSYTATFKQESLENVLLNMSVLRPFDYRVTNDSLILSFRK